MEIFNTLIVFRYHIKTGGVVKTIKQFQKGVSNEQGFSIMF